MAKKKQRSLVGSTITVIRAMTPEELDAEGWEDRRGDLPAMVIVLNDGTLLYPSRDSEGNGPGALFGARPDGKNFIVTAE